VTVEMFLNSCKSCGEVQAILKVKCSRVFYSCLLQDWFSKWTLTCKLLDALQ